DAADFAAGDRAHVDPLQLVAQQLLALVGGDHVGPELLEVGDAAAAEVQVVLVEQVAAQAAAVQVRVAHGRTHHGIALAGGGGGQAADVGDLALGGAHPVFLEPD